MDGSAAEMVGLVVGDRIVTVNGKEMKEPKDVVGEIGQLAEGEEIEVVIEREGERRSVVAKLRGFPATSSAQKQFDLAAQQWERGKL